MKNQNKIESVPKHIWVLAKNRGEALRIEQKVLNPTNIAAWSNSLVSVSRRIRRPCFFLLRERKWEEVDSFSFQLGDEVHRDTMVDDLEEAKLLAGLNEEGFGVRLWEVYERNSREGHAVSDERQLFNCWFREDTHGGEGFGRTRRILKMGIGCWWY